MTSSQNGVGKQFLNQRLAQISPTDTYVRGVENLIEFGGRLLRNAPEYIQKSFTEEEKPESGDTALEEGNSSSAEAKPPIVNEQKDPGPPGPYVDQSAGQNSTNVIPAITELMKMTAEQQKAFLGGITLEEAIKLAERESRETNRQLSQSAKEREVIAQWGATQRAMVQRDAAMALGLMNTAYLANTPNVSLMQQLNAPLAAVASNYKLPLPGGNK